MGFSFVVDFTGLPSDRTLRSLPGDDLCRVDPLEYVAGNTPKGDANAVGECVVAYCSGAAVAIDVAIAQRERTGTAPHVVLIDPTPVDEGFATSVLSETLVENGRDKSLVDPELLVRCVRASPAQAERDFANIIRPLLQARLKRLGLEQAAAVSSSKELAQRFGRWARYLAWALAEHPSLAYDGPVSVLQVDPRSTRLDIGGSGTRHITEVEYTPGAYLSAERVLQETQRRLSAAPETVDAPLRAHRR